VYKWNKNNSTTLPSNALISFQNLAFPFYTHSITTVYHFKLPNANTSDEGLYCCVASNECGSSTECAKLEVDSKLQY